jgi:lysozyme
MALTVKQRVAAASALATAIAVPAEGLRQWAYSDPVGILTICYGHTGTDVIKGQHKTIEQCKAILTADMQHHLEIVERCQPGLPVPVLAAFGDAVFNAGGTIACDTNRSTAARYLKLGQYDQACLQLDRWNKARIGGSMVELPGLTKRRARERDLCLTWRQT